MDELFRASVQALCADFYPPEVIQHWAGQPSAERIGRGQARGDEHFVLMRRGRLVAFGALNLERELLEALFVAPSFAGQGVGRELLDFLVDLARSAGLTRLKVNSSLNAVAFYQANGFVEYGRGDFALSGGVTLDSVFLERRLRG
ncbi:MAG: GNAT family N-acetyltransferase [Gammaproteobacteria bacterium]